jgi:hypothetical protein
LARLQGAVYSARGDSQLGITRIMYLAKSGTVKAVSP